MGRQIVRTEAGGKFYRVCQGFWFHDKTKPNIIEWILTAYERKSRMRFYWGDAESGLDWGEVHDVAGYIGRSTGAIKIPLLIHSKRSHGGPAMLDHCIVKISYANKRYCKTPVYEHPNYHVKAGG